MKDLYITSTFTNQWNIDFSTKLCNFLEKNSFNCYLPYRDTNQDDIRLEIFKQDIKGIEDSLIMLAVALNETPN